MQKGPKGQPPVLEWKMTEDCTQELLSATLHGYRHGHAAALGNVNELKAIH